MNVKAILLAIFMVFMTTNSFAALQEMTNEEMSDTNLPIFGEGMNEKVARLLLEGFKMNDAQAIAYVKEVNSLAAAIKRGEVTEQNFMIFFSSHLMRLESIGVPREILGHQADIFLRAQEQALRAQQQLEMQRALFQRFVSEITRVANDFRTNPNATITIRLDYIFQNIPEININQVIRDALGTPAGMPRR